MGKHFFSSEYDHVTHQITENETDDKMQANNLPVHTLDPWGGHFFLLLKVVMLHIKLRGRLVMHIQW